MVTIGDRLREERGRLGFTQEEIAELAGTTKKTVIDYEKGNTSPKADFLAKLSELDFDVSYIVTGNSSVISEPSSSYYLSPEKKALLDNFEHCSKEDRNAISRMAFLAAKEAEDEKKSNTQTKRSA